MRFSIITPTFNMGPWIAETIESVLAQEGEFEIEYILADGGSTDNTVQIFNEYKARLERGDIPVRCKGITMQSFSEKDKGTFDAINKGFARATGSLYTWCDADNTYVPGAFAGLTKVVQTFPEIEWLKGYSSVMTEEGHIMHTRQTPLYRQDWLASGIYGRDSYYVNAETVFWSAALWKSCGPIPTEFRCAGEQWLWMRTAKKTPLWAVNLHIAHYRKRKGQLSASGGCKAEQKRMRPPRDLSAWAARAFFSPQSRLYPKGEKFFLWLYPKLFMPTKQEYIDFADGVPVKKTARSFIIGDTPTYKEVAEA